MCTVSDKLLITKVNHGAGTKECMLIAELCVKWLVLISEVDCH